MSDSDRVLLSYVEEQQFAITPAAIKAQGSLTVGVQPIGENKANNILQLATIPTNADTITIDGKPYTFQTVLTQFDGNVAIGGSLAQAQLNLERAIKLSGGIPGTDYANNMTVHPTVTISAFGASVVDEAIVTAKVAGTAGNSIATISSLSAGGDGFTSGTLLLGTNPDTFTIGIKVYTLTNTLNPTVDGQIQIGVTLSATQINIERAINLTGTAGIEYSAATTANTDVSAGGFATNVSIITALLAGTLFNSLVLASAFASASNFFDNATLGNVTAGTDVQLKEIRMTGETLIQNTDTGNSAEVRDDRQLADLIRTNLSAGGDINNEMSFESHEDFLAAGLFSSGFSDNVNLSGSTYFYLAADNSLNDEDGNLVNDGLVQGEWLKTTGAQNAVNNQIGKITSLTPSKAILRTQLPLVDEQDTGIQAQGTLTMPVQPIPDTLAEGTLTIDTIPSDGDIMIVGGKTYTFQDTLTDFDGNIENAITLAQCQINIENAINLTGIPGFGYATSMSINPQAAAGTFAADDSIFTSKLPGVLGNAVVTTTSFTAGSNVFDAVTLGTTTAGVDGDSITIDGKQYFYTDDASILNFNGAIDIGSVAVDAQNNTRAAINLTGVPGTDYSLATTIHPTVSAGAFASDDSIMTAKIAGAGGNALATTSIFTSGSNFFDAATLGTTTIGSGNADQILIEQGSSIVNGTLQRTFTIEREYTDLSGAFARFIGMIVDGFNIDVEAENIINGAFTFVGKKEVDASTSAGSIPPLELSTAPVMTAIEDTNAVVEGGTEFAATQFGVTVANNTRARAQIGVEGAISIGAGVIEVTGNLQAYFENLGIVAKYINFDTSNLAMIISDKGGNFYVIDLPKIKYSEGARTTPGQNSDVLAELSYTALRCPSENVTIRIVKFIGVGVIDDC